MIQWYLPTAQGAIVSQAFKADAKSIGDLLTGIDKPKLVVPPFQRGYSWEGKHIQAFWKDLTEFQKEKSDGVSEKYFLGPIVVLFKDSAITVILDGQQRIATATILFAVIRDAARAIGTTESEAFAQAIHVTFIAKDDAGDHLGYSLELGSMDKLYFLETVQQPTPTKAKPQIKSHRNIQVAYRILKGSLDARLAGLKPTDAISCLKQLRNTVRSDLIMTCIPVSEEREAFRIFETLNDRGLRLSVPDLLLNYLMREAPEAHRADIRTHWNQMVEKMGRRSIGPFLRHLWVSEFGDVKHDLFTAIKNHIEANGVVSLAYSSECAKACSDYCALLDYDESQLGNNAKHVKSLLGALDCQAALPLLLSAYTHLKPPNLGQLLKWLLVFVVRHSVIARSDSAELETLLFSQARWLREQMRDTSKESKYMNAIKDELKKKAPSDDKVKASLADLVVSSDEATYILTRIANHLQSNTKEIKVNEANVEHIFPRRPSDEWNNKDALERFLWHIGNLTMLGTRLNDGVGNRGFAFKRKIYESASELEMARLIANQYTEWDEHSIADRAARLATPILEIWNFDNPSRV